MPSLPILVVGAAVGAAGSGSAGSGSTAACAAVVCLARFTVRSPTPISAAMARSDDPGFAKTAAFARSPGSTYGAWQSHDASLPRARPIGRRPDRLRFWLSRGARLHARFGGRPHDRGRSIRGGAQNGGTATPARWQRTLASRREAAGAEGREKHPPPSLPIAPAPMRPGHQPSRFVPWPPHSRLTGGLARQRETTRPPSSKRGRQQREAAVTAPVIGGAGSEPRTKARNRSTNPPRRRTQPPEPQAGRAILTARRPGGTSRAIPPSGTAANPAAAADRKPSRTKNPPARTVHPCQYRRYRARRC